MDDGDPREEIERLEAQIDTLADRIESCRKFILAARVAMAAGGIALVAMLFGVVWFDLSTLSVAMAAVLIGIVMAGANSSTAQHARAELTAAEARRKALIGTMELREVAAQQAPAQSGGT